MADIASLAVALHLNSASFKSQIHDAYSSAVNESKKFAQQIEAGSIQSERAVTRMSNQIRRSSGQAAVGFGNLHHVLTELVSGSNVAASTISNALVPALERFFGSSKGSSFEMQREAAKEAAQSAVEAAQASIEAAKADATRAQQGLKTAQAMKKQAAAQIEQAIAADEYIEKMRVVNEQSGYFNNAEMSKEYAAQHEANARIITEASLAETAAKQKSAVASAQLTAAQEAETVASKQLATAKRQLATANKELNILQRTTGKITSGFSNLVSLMGGPVNVGLMAAAGAGFYLYNQFEKLEEQTKAFNEAIAQSGNLGIFTAEALSDLADSIGGTDEAYKSVALAVRAGFGGETARLVATQLTVMKELGFDVEKVAKAYGDMRKAPLNAMQELLQAGVNIDENVAKQVINLSRLGKTAEASAALQQYAFSMLSDKVDEYNKKLSQTPGFLVGIRAEFKALQDLAKGGGLGDWMNIDPALIKMQVAINKAAQLVKREQERQANEARNAAREKLLKQIEEGLKTSGTAKVDAGQQRLAQLQKESISLQAQLKYTDSMTASQKQLLAFEIEIASWKGQTLTTQQQSILASRAQIEAQLQSNAVIEKQLEDQKTLNDLIMKGVEEANKKGEKEANRGNIKGGFQQGFKDFSDEATNMFENVRNVTKNAFDGMSTMLTDFVTTGKFNFSDFAQSVVNDITQMIIKMMIFKALEAGTKGTAFGDFLFGKNAQGGVYQSPGLSAYSNTIVKSPTLFPFAKGMGLMGEAGPEAIMPLQRGSDGSLGVRAMGGVSTSDITINQTIHVSGNGDKALYDAMQQAAEMGARQGANDAIARIQRDFATNGRTRKILGA
ncbi:phage tail tape measure C-terminal domain-containing protein [Arsenophonus nasoniae]|uniref:Phage tail tape measure C-terminal domain-containing protein n=1 Tax=Arsenophonus nasoniae TaxID=638 RepID=A0AA95GD45_9GAMM|nr:phage tail tape measure C-terminal domain-containing protein [Arsenophonus nasoniae]WGL93751.1 phage tail tape measure C-terminal domain-containing protein [Arsenophonus nasoniae]WGL96037.1 phage tail tape measure C-terminal domain-containing protein [Arsenophonus nasoniae]